MSGRYQNSYKKAGDSPQITAKKIREGYTYFTVRYDGWGSKFRVVLVAKNTKEAREYFEKYFPLATVISIKEGGY